MGQPTEGVIRFRYSLRPPAAPFDGETLAVLNAWRRILRGVGLLGQTPTRYDGYGFGNVSAREGGANGAFLITGTQTGALDALQPTAFTRVVGVDLAGFAAEAEGVTAPSSEALTHASIYRADASIRWVFHGHSPDIFAAVQALALPTIAAAVEYGTSEMAGAVAALLAQHPARPLVFVSLGHEDGVFACGADADAVGAGLITTLARALASGHAHRAT